MDNKTDAEILYGDIINMTAQELGELPQPRMSLINRAKQFSPFAALQGYNESIAQAGETSEGDRE